MRWWVASCASLAAGVLVGAAWPLRTVSPAPGGPPKGLLEQRGFLAKAQAGGEVWLREVDVVVRPAEIVADGVAERLRFDLVVTSNLGVSARMRYAYSLGRRAPAAPDPPVVSETLPLVPARSGKAPFVRRLELGPLDDGFYDLRVVVAAVANDGTTAAHSGGLMFAVAHGQFWYLPDYGDWLMGCVRP